MKRFIYEYPGILSLTWAGIILFLCATPGRYIPSVSWLELLSFDKWVHAGIFFVLSVLLLIFSHKSGYGRSVTGLFVILSIAYGVLMELMQAMYFSERSADWLDVAANSFGSVLALFFMGKIRRLVRDHRGISTT